VYDNVFQALDAVFPDRPKAEKAHQIEKILGTVGLWEHRDKKPGQISGGI
jgi:ABC-type nitrate/sulfonate/bicarbonate transport system ATPase subunit